MTKDARAWLKDNGYNVKPKGRIPADLLAIYQAKVKNGDIDLGDDRNLDIGNSDGDFDNDDSRNSKKKVKRSSCGFCTVNASYRHQHCPGSINQGKMGVWTCLCYEKGHTLYVLCL